MALTVWTQPSGSLGLFQEGSNFNLQLPVISDNEVKYSVISGKLPGGLWLQSDYILGTPFEVARDTDFSFCIRASKNNQIADRTFTITISGSDSPVILTPAGVLDVGPYKQLFVVDNSFVNYQLTAIDNDTLAGQTLTYFITEGVLPPGLSLTPDGVIYGIVDAVTTLKLEEGNGAYDHGFYGVGPYDFANPQAQNGYDVLKYDYAGIGYDYFTISQPRVLNRIYEFVIAVTDGDTLTPPQRKFQLYVVNPAYFRADSESLISNSNVYTADVTYNQQPVWVTSPNLGTYRANNYLTFVLDVFDTGSVYYKLEQVNALSIAYAKRRSLQDNRIGSYTISTIATAVSPQVGHYIKFNGSNIYNRVVDVMLYSTNEYTLTLASPLDINVPNGLRFFVGTKSQLPPGMSFDNISGDVFGKVPAQAAITTSYNFTVSAIRVGDADSDETNVVPRVFTVDIIGEIDSVIIWNTQSDLGVINAGYTSLLAINATTTLLNATIIYNIVSGKLPPGLSLAYDGEITGSVSQYTNQIIFDNYTTIFDTNPAIHKLTFDNDTCIFNAGLTTFGTQITSAGEVPTRFYDKSEDGNMQLRIFDNNLTTFLPAYFTTFNNSIKRDGLLTFDLRLPTSTTFDNNNTTIDRVYKFTVAASDQSQISISNREFLITINTPNTLNYSNIYVKPFMTMQHRDTWSKFINNSSIFTPSSVYRPYDSAFGIQDGLTMLIYAGVETKTINEYSLLTTETVKRFRFENVYKAIAFYPGTKTPIYEVIYVKMIDPMLYQTTYNKSNVNTWRSQIATLGELKWDYLPIWMRSVQPDYQMELGFILAVPLCFCKVGTADDILLNIKYSDFDFKLLDYTIDRFIINKVIGEESDKYIVFNNRNLQ